MKKFYILVALFFALAVSAFAVDTIVLLNGTMIDAKIEEITPSEIKYRRADNLKGPLYTINKNEVLSIKYDNGTVEVVNASEPKKEIEKEPKKPRLDPNRLYVGFSVEPSGFISGGPSATLDITKGAVNSTIHVSFPTLALNSVAKGFGFGAGAGLNYFWNGPIGGFYVGGQLEWNMMPYSHYVIENSYYGTYDPVSDSFMYSSSSKLKKDSAHSFILGLNGGYKFILGNGIYFRTGITTGWFFSKFYSAGFYYKPDLAAGYIF